MEPGKQFEQLPMFMTARELHDPSKITHNDFELDGVRPTDEAGMASAWRRKLSEATANGLRESIDRHGGVENPVSITHGMGGLPRLSDGHHRVASAFVRNPESLVPVAHRDMADVFRRNVAARGPQVDPYATSNGWNFLPA